MMTPLFKKLNFKGQAAITVLHAPDSFGTALAEMAAFTDIHTREDELVSIEFALVFATRQSEIDEAIERLSPKLMGDAVLWFCYPKGSSKNYTCEFNRDTGWATLGQHGFEGVRQVAIDDDWSALRFRKTEYIKTLTRSADMMLSDTGKQRIAKSDLKN
jgi:hypothetical protein